MEYQNTNESLFELNFTENVKTQLKGAAVWAGIAAVLSLVSSVIGIIARFTGAAAEEAKRQVEDLGETAVRVQAVGNVIGVVIMVAVYALLFLFLIRFSNLTKNGLSGNNQEMISKGLGGLSSYFITIGVLFILISVFVLLALAGLAIGAGGSR